VALKSAPDDGKAAADPLAEILNIAAVSDEHRLVAEADLEERLYTVLKYKDTEITTGKKNFRYGRAATALCVRSLPRVLSILQPWLSGTVPHNNSTLRRMLIRAKKQPSGDNSV
jgi:hypothetical protein